MRGPSKRLHFNFKNLKKILITNTKVLGDKNFYFKILIILKIVLQFIRCIWSKYLF